MKRVVLPSGKTIEVVYFRHADGVETQHPAAEPHQDLHVCAECDSELVYPTEW